MFKNVKPVRLLQVFGLALVLSLSVVLVGCGSGSSDSSDPIIGKWNMNSVQTDSSTGPVESSGSATIGKDGSVSIELNGNAAFTGTWATIPKEEWPESASAKFLGHTN